VIARVLAGLVAACMCVAAPVAAAQPSGAAVQFRLSDPRLGEISGIATSITSPHVVYVENDGGDAARFFALDARTGAVRGVYTVPGAHNVDWEDIAVAPDAAGRPSVWLADIGDNAARRGQIEIYRVDEPRVNMAASNVAVRTARPDVWQLTYPDGAHDAESLAVSPAGIPYIVTKSLLGSSGVYRAKGTPGRFVLSRVASIRFHPTSTPGPFAPIGQLTATGADFSRDGRAFVVRTYTDAYVWRVTAGGVPSALRFAPIRIALPYQPQGEGICFDDDHLLIDSEQVGSAVYSVPLPARPTASPSRSAASASASVSASASHSAGPSRSAPASATAPETNDQGSGALLGWSVGGAAAAVAVLLAIAFGLRRRSREGQRS
jgi:hypothetical protein